MADPRRGPSPSPLLPYGLLLAALLAWPGCYVVHASVGQLKILWGRRDVDQVLGGGGLSTQHRERLELVQQVRRYAFDEIGLEPTGSYSCFFDTGRDPVGWNVSASPPDALAPYLWTFPFVGTVPYVGYFDAALAVEEARRLKAMGLDVAILPITAYSTLGWFDDPVFSSMLDRSEADLASTIIHELAHGTVWVDGDVELNENLASFIGDEGARRFFLARGGPEDPALVEAKRDEADLELLTDALGGLQRRVDRAYESTGSRAAKLAFKEAAVQAFREDYTQRLRGQLNTEGYDWIASGEIPLNNAVLLTFRRYHGDEDLLKALFARCGSDLGRFVAALQEVAEEDEPRAALEARLEREG